MKRLFLVGFVIIYGIFNPIKFWFCCEDKSIFSFLAVGIWLSFYGFFTLRFSFQIDLL